MIENSWEIKNWFQIHSQFANLLKLIPMSFGLCVVFWFCFVFCSVLFSLLLNTGFDIWNFMCALHCSEFADWPIVVCVFTDVFFWSRCSLCLVLVKRVAQLSLFLVCARARTRPLARLHIYTLPHLNMNEKYFMIGATCLQLLRLFFVCIVFVNVRIMFFPCGAVCIIWTYLTNA